MSNNMKSLSFKEKIIHIWEFYRLRILLVAAIILLSSILIVHYTTKKETSIYVCVFSDTKNEALQSKIMDEYPSFSNTKGAFPKVDLIWNFSYLDDKDMIWPDAATSLKYVTFPSTHECDVIICEKETLIWSADQELIMPVDKALSKEYVDKYKDLFVYLDENAKTKVDKSKPYGINLSKAPNYIKGAYDEGILTFCTYSENKDAQIKFLDFMFDGK